MMIEESAIVVAVEGEMAWLETKPKSACGHCSIGNSCGTSTLAKWFANKRNKVQVINHLGLQKGDIAIIGISDEVLVKSAFVVYMLPLIFMLIIATAASAMGSSNGVVAIYSVCGLLAGLFTMKWMNQSENIGTVTLVRKESTKNYIPVEINITERGYIHG